MILNTFSEVYSAFIYSLLCDVYMSFAFVIGLLCDVEFLVFFICYRYQSFVKIMICIILSGISKVFHRMKKIFESGYPVASEIGL